MLYIDVSHHDDIINRDRNFFWKSLISKIYRPFWKSYKICLNKALKNYANEKDRRKMIWNVSSFHFGYFPYFSFFKGQMLLFNEVIKQTINKGRESIINR